MKFSKRSCALSAGLLLLVAAAQAQTNPFAKGPDPTDASIAANGPFTVTTSTVTGSGFGGATVFAPTAAGTYALVAFCPGFTASQSSVQVMGRRLASHGFVVATLDTNSRFDQPPSRATQLIATLNRVATVNPGGKVDTTRRAVTGHSMGGGGTLIASLNNPSLKAGVSLAPYSTSVTNFGNMRVPSQISVGSADTVARPGTHSIPFYNSIPNTTPKLLAVIRGEDHGFPQENPADQPSSKYQIAWMKRFADNDTRYSQFLDTDALLSDFRTNGLF
jgi:dienelactone hydrolase